MSDQRFTECKKKRLSLDAKKTVDKETLRNKSLDLLVTKDAIGQEVWEVTFATKYGLSTCLYCPTSTKWKKEKGKASGYGIKNMLKYFNPIN